ncbi:MAG: SCO family protein [Acidobacteriota bacterium]|nr:SCO family protein [Acidobacteriota bacterium]
MKIFREHVTCWSGFAILLAVAAATVGCNGAHKPSVLSARAPRQFAVRGVVLSTDAATGDVMLDHEAIPGLMDAMTMSYRLQDASVISELHRGDTITATLTALKGVKGADAMRLGHIVVIAQGQADTVPKVQYHIPVVGDIVPDYALLNQSGRRIRMSEFRGKVVLLTFIYTRCAMADFCPKMSRNFAEIDKALAGDPALYARTHLLSISFDPKYDTPKVLRSYGGAYTGKYTNEKFAHWDFAAPSVAELPKVEQFFDLGVTPGDGKSLMHSLATVIVGKDGKVVAFYPTNDWTTDALVQQIRAAAV